MRIVCQHPSVAPQPVPQTLGPHRLGVRIVRQPERRDENLRLASIDVDCHAVEVHKHRIARIVALAHSAPTVLRPGFVAAAKIRVGMPVALVAKLRC